LGMIIC